MKLIILVLLIFSCNLFGQSNYSITGTVKDSNKNDLPFVNLLLLKHNDSSFVKGVVSNEKGNYKFDLIDKGSYIILTSMIGFSSAYSELISVDKDYQLEILLIDQGESLEEIIIKGDKPLYEQKIDRLIINVENSIVSAGGSALEILERLPGVIINRQSSSITIVGKDGVQIMINGKMSYVPISSLIQMLDGMRADNIESIELITTPPANLDSEGNAGFINIVTKKSSDLGLNGSYSLSAGYGAYPVTSDNINFNYRKNKINFYGNYSFSIDKNDQVFFTSREYLNTNDVIYTETTSYRETIQRDHNLRLGFDYEISNKTVMGILLDGYDNKWSMDTFNESFDAENGISTSYVDLVLDEINYWKHFGANFNILHKFSTDKTMSFDLNYLQYDNDNPTNYLNSYYDENNIFLYDEMTRSGKTTPLRTWVGNFDYSNVLNDKIKIETGLKGTFSTFENDVFVDNFENNEWVEDSTLTDKSNFDENIFAVYGSFDYNFSKNMILKFGLRYEYTDSRLDTESEGNVVDRQYHEFFPTLFLNRKFNDDLSMNLSYSKRITRPTFRELAPFVILLDPNTFISGNPALQPTISNSIKYDLNFKSYILSLQYTNEDGSIVRFQEYLDEDTGRLIFQSENLDYTKTFSATFGFPINVTDWWRMQYNLLLVSQNIGAFYDDEPVELSLAYIQANTTQTFKFLKNYTAEFTGYFKSPSYIGTSKMEALYSVNFGLQKKFSNKWGTLRFSIDDLMDSYKWRIGTDLSYQNIKTINEFNFSGRTLKLTYSRSFGNNKLKSSRKRKTGAEEERNRAN